ncbi:probable deoxycytidylate deaminase [Episyrphus balteatus]|uniref:probable deoxycytidylate deaminase n=1 Tax=Episyrphus balteatus TaxID=286459 RepID=UPI00248654C2|nr:probable deoxycytidylate deaminase [Episyrphus balteatus]XP_055853751.1 probable deoxycytidylate deaminase [Episyrphus balteatus]XP_055853753.1 probable deoxycytidylate deaminase [Episyrphus balteatus]XP_055853754.1 probable deoxycytidylate deaminase [Episyrphus balteatus]XP_055853755.1 probable deoxycytidylate deaminase [Episyrphus balteatus]
MSQRTDYLSWEDYFMATALLTSQRSKDPVTQVGACIVDKDNLILAVGYNGFPRNCNDEEFPWCKDKENPFNDKKMYVVHAEANAILNKNSANLTGALLYTTLFPCNECTKIIIQSGIKEVIYVSDKHHEKPTYHASKRMLDAVGIKHRRYTPTKKKIVLDFDLFAGEEETIDLSKLKITLDK